MLLQAECVSALWQQANAPLLGHALSLLLQVAEQEAAAGDRGSRLLRADAFRAMDVLMRKARRRLARCALYACLTPWGALAGWRPARSRLLPARHQQRAVQSDSQVGGGRTRGACPAYTRAFACNKRGLY